MNLGRRSVRMGQIHIIYKYVQSQHYRNLSRFVSGQLLFHISQRIKPLLIVIFKFSVSKLSLFDTH